jgi:phosphoglycerate dehydrogenase-like enzyme
MPARHLHIENNTRASALSHVKPAHVEAAVARHPALGALKITIGWDADILDEALRGADYLISSRPPRDHLRGRAPKLRWIQTTGAGVDHLLPLDWLPADIVLTNNSGPHGPKCEDFCTMALLALSARLPRLMDQQRERRWESLFTVPIAGKTCVVIGYGDLGQAAARAGKKLGLTVIAVNRSGKGAGPADRLVASSQADELLPLADFVIVTAPLTAETRDFMGRRRLALLRPEAGIVNVARAPLVDYTALEEVLRAGRLAGAILDVHDPEPLPSDSRLWSVPNLMLTPHISCDDPRYVDMLLDAWAANLARLDSGEGLKNVVDRIRGY